jgi:hypothetical protein
MPSHRGLSCYCCGQKFTIPNYNPIFDFSVTLTCLITHNEEHDCMSGYAYMNNYQGAPVLLKVHLPWVG